MHHVLSDFLGDNTKAKTMCEAFEKNVMPHRSWTLTGEDLTKALAAVPGTRAAVASNEDDAAGAAFGGMPVKTETLATPPAADTECAGVDSTPPLTGRGRSREERAADQKVQLVSEAADEMVNAVNQVVSAAIAVGNAAHQVAHACDRPADEPMSTANRAAD